MTHTLAQKIGQYKPDDDSGKGRKFHIITEQSDARGRSHLRPKCGQDGWRVTEDSIKDEPEEGLSDEDLQRRINMGVVCGNCAWLHQKEQ